MDTMAKLWDIHSGHEVATLAVDHMIQCSLVMVYFRATPLKLSVSRLILLENHFSLAHLIIQYLYGMLLLESECYLLVSQGMLCTGDGRRSYTLIGHREEISSAVYNYDASMIATGSMVHLFILYEYICCYSYSI